MYIHVLYTASTYLPFQDQCGREEAETPVWSLSMSVPLNSRNVSGTLTRFVMCTSCFMANSMKFYVKTMWNCVLHHTGDTQNTKCRVHEVCACVSVFVCLCVRLILKKSHVIKMGDVLSWSWHHRAHRSLTHNALLCYLPTLAANFPHVCVRICNSKNKPGAFLRLRKESWAKTYEERRPGLRSGSWRKWKI